MKRILLPERPLTLLIAVLLFVLSFHPLPLWFLVFSFVPIFIVALRNLTFREGFRSGYFFGFLISLLLLYWVAWVTIAGFIALLVAHSLYYAVIGGLLAKSTRKFGNKALVLFPFTWVAVEYLRSLSQVSFPWLNLSYTQVSNLAVVQLAELSGDPLVSFFILAVGVLVYLGAGYAYKPVRAVLLVGAALLLYSGVYLWGSSRIEPVDADLEVAVLQGNVSNEDKWRQGRIDHNFRIYEELSGEAAAEGAEFVLWPETAVPCYLRGESGYLAWIENIARQFDIDILTGALDYTKDKNGKSQYFNAAFLFASNGVDKQTYRKNHLVPFSEHIPYEEQVTAFDSFKEFLFTKFELDISNFAPGDSIIIFETQGRKLGTLICWEVVYPQYVREVVNSGADFLCVITNDAWFGETAGPHQHAAIPVFRAVENRSWVIRAANTGISEIIDPFGRIIASTEMGERTFLRATIGVIKEETIFNRFGLVLSRICLAVAFVGVLLLFSGKRSDE